MELNKLELIQDQLKKAKEELRCIASEETQLAYDYVEFALILANELTMEDINEIPSNCILDFPN